MLNTFFGGAMAGLSTSSKAIPIIPESATAARVAVETFNKQMALLRRRLLDDPRAFRDIFIADGTAVWLEVLRDKQCEERPCEVGMCVEGNAGSPKSSPSARR